MARPMVPGYGVGTLVPWMVVRVEEVDLEASRAVVIDEFGSRKDVNPYFRRGKSLLPVANELWVIDCFLGEWAFAAVMEAVIPEVTGTTDGIPALESLLAVLDQAGVISNNTTSTRIRSTHTHTHSIPDGSTGPDPI